MSLNLNANAQLGLNTGNAELTRVVNDPYNTLAFSQYPGYFGSSGSSTLRSIDSLGLGGGQSGAFGGGLGMINLEIELIMAALQMIEQQLQQYGGGEQPQSGAPQAGSGNGSGVTADPIFASNPGATQSPAGNEKYFDLGSGGSTGDPHLSFAGGSTSGNPNAKWDDMHSQSDLVDANESFFGGYQVSTLASQPDSRGVTYNQSATVATGDNRDTVTMGKNGQVTVLDDGKAVAIDKGQSVTLSSGATVTENKDGSVTVDDNNNRGGKMSTTMSWNGNGVDVHFNSSNVYLGGDLPGMNQQQSEGIVG